MNSRCLDCRCRDTLGKVSKRGNSVAVSNPPILSASLLSSELRANVLGFSSLLSTTQRDSMRSDGRFAPEASQSSLFDWPRTEPFETALPSKAFGVCPPSALRRSIPRATHCCAVLGVWSCLFRCRCRQVDFVIIRQRFSEFLSDTSPRVPGIPEEKVVGPYLRLDLRLFR